MTKIPTIRRRKSWPKWGKWYAIDYWHGPAIYRSKPVEHHPCGGMTALHGFISADSTLAVSGPRLSRDWTKSLRRIVP